MKIDTAAAVASLTIKLEDGTAESMGCGIYVIRQFDETTGTPQHVALSTKALEGLKTFMPAQVPVELGFADYVGDGLWSIAQRQESSDNWQDVIISLRDAQTLLAA
jgi:hypothetical protein